MPHRELLLGQLKNYRPCDAGDSDTCIKVQDFVRSQQECFERSLTQGHITGSAWVIDPERKAVLLVEHRKLGKWLQPGGHADGESDVLNVARRELEEETGLGEYFLADGQKAIFDLDIHEIPPCRGVAAHLHYDVRFLFVSSVSCQVASNNESRQVKWVQLDELPNYNAEQSLLRMRAKTLLLQSQLSLAKQYF